MLGEERSDGQQPVRLLGEAAAVQRPLQRRLERRGRGRRPPLVAEHGAATDINSWRRLSADARHSDEALDVTLVATDVDRTWGSGGAQVHGPVGVIAARLTGGDESGLSGTLPPAPRWL